MKISNEAKAGIMITAVVVLLVALTLRTGNFNFSNKGYHVKIYFKNVDGIDKNAPVMLNGYEVGMVKDISIQEAPEGALMEVLVWLKEEAKLRSGTRAYVKNLGFMGEKYVSLTSGDQAGEFLVADAKITGDESADFDVLLRDGQQIAKNIKEVAANINERLKRNQEAIDRIIGNFDTTMGNVASITDNFDERLQLNEDNIDGFLTNINSSSVNLDQFTYDLKLNPWKLLYRTKEKRQKSIDMMQEQAPSDNNFSAAQD